ncbi:MAG: hypothetical protein HN674_08875 [Candidatus Marinimicrobia bacterium]|nr:hypothetical protein [Candidatus Neomarinimicrobiota bacterium]MBT5758256.1 hypothetical protein [Candidatus Neomarinimicrobiota bacterium]MBT7823230.1 hypothetical protein [Candidatus Neomarinimicrobiota bacterium]
MWIFMIACYLLMFINFINLLMTGLAGYFQFDIIGANHVRFALFMILIFIITETVVMYFFISTGKGIKLAIEKGLGDMALWDREKQLKMKVFPQLMLTLFLVGTVFVHGGAVDNKMESAWLHGPFFIIAFGHHIWSLIIKNNAFKEQIAIISELKPDPEQESK